MLKNGYQNWLKDNPLRQFRDDNDLSRTRFAGHLGVTVNTVQFWENGTNFPNDENLEKIAIVMKKSPQKLRAEWNDWLETKPDIKII